MEYGNKVLFEVVGEEFRKTEGEVTLPRRGDPGSAGHDFYSNEDVVIKGNRVVQLSDGEYGLKYGEHTFWTDVKVKLPEDKVMLVEVRSSIGIKYHGNLKNSTGVIDASYYFNPKTDGNVGINIVNYSTEDIVIKRGERIAQGLVVNYYVAEDDKPIKETRDGGTGSSGK